MKIPADIREIVKGEAAEYRAAGYRNYKNNSQNSIYAANFGKLIPESSQ